MTDSGGQPVVGIDLVKARLLLGALDRSAVDARHRADLLALALGAAGEDRALVGPLRAFALWAEARRAALRVVVDVLATGEAAGRPPAWVGIAIWLPPADDAFADPGPALGAAEATISAEQSGDGDRLAELLGWWADNPVFAAAVLGRLGARSIAAAVARLGDLLASASDVDRRTQEQIVIGLAVAIAAARRAGSTGLSLEAL